jgi:hypothetical protein
LSTDAEARRQLILPFYVNEKDGSSWPMRQFASAAV